ncbi:CALCIUM-BINDING PROTEIN 39-RELATED [Salix koriyanagi]|uniref:CALCIUM-BINDING PROTEIN 39-RELATED n=2 Tax=Salix TaxID=40685 RepID=A0A9Q0X6Y3_9ROSI|nr:CALCIUM-BINDING PROTEIN 39-RELATED [Salix koriyanagi]
MYEKIGLYFTYLAVSDSRGKIGVCVSKPAAAAAREEVVVRRLSPLPQSPVPAAAAATKGHSGLLTNSKSGHSGLLSSKSGQLGGDSKRMKGLFKSKPRTPVDIVRQTRDILIFADQSSTSLSDSKREEKMAELAKNIRELKSILYGNSESEPVSEACAQLTQEFFRENTLRLLIVCLPQLNLEARKDATQIVANLQRQQVNSRLIASDYLEKNTDLLDILIAGYANTDMALHYGVMLRECIRHQTVARYVLESPNVKKLFDYIQLPYFDISADAAATFKELLTRHKSTVAEFLSKNYDWFFGEFNSKLLESTNYITRRQAVKLLGDILLDRSNAVVMTRYVSSRDNLRILMNLLRESSKSIQVEAFHVFKLFVANQNKPPDIISILVANRSKLLRLFADFKIDKEDEQFEADKAQVVREIASLEPRE